MKGKFENRIKELQEIIHLFDEESILKKLSILNYLSKGKFSISESLVTYVDLLMFICAYPSDPIILQVAKRELDRITNFLRLNIRKKSSLLLNSGLPFTTSISFFTHDFCNWLITYPNCKISINKFENATLSLNDVLKFTLPTLEKSQTTMGFSNEELFEHFSISKFNQLNFILTEINKLNDQPYIKDFLYASLGIFIELKSTNKHFSKQFNFVSNKRIFFHDELIKKFDHQALLNTPVKESVINLKRRNEIVTVIKNSMALTDRETDPISYMQESSLRYYELDRGFSVAIYGMIPQRQMPLESYIGYTLFKNGYPAAYGGGWVFGKRSDFGINIFESFRGGESGYVMCQLLRVFRQVFNVSYFEVEAYQYGLDNPDGIKTGAFWFYYRYGFRPIDKAINKLADSESRKILNNKKYRSSNTTLVKFTESNIGLQLGSSKPVSVYDITTKVMLMMKQKFKGDRLLAESKCITSFLKSSNTVNDFNHDEKKVLTDVALWASAYNITNKEKLKLLIQMIHIKPIDPFKYQELLLNYFND